MFRFLSLLLALAPLLRAAETAGGGSWDLRLGDGQLLGYLVPPGWDNRATPARGKQPARSVFSAPALSMQFTVFTGDAPLARLDTPPALAARVEELAAPFVPASVEGKANLVGLAQDKLFGSYATFTDKALVGKPLPPGEFRTMTVGLVRLPGATVQFSLLADNPQAEPFAQALAVLKSFTLKPGLPERAAPGGPDFAALAAKLRAADAAAEADAALAKGDRRFVGVMGIALAVPGVAWSPELRQRYGVRLLEGTGDVISGEAQREYQLAAADYARRYNTRLAAKLGLPAAPAR